MLILVLASPAITLQATAGSIHKTVLPTDSISLTSPLSVMEIFNQIEKQTLFKFAFNASDIDEDVLFDFEGKRNWLLEDLLFELSKRLDLKFTHIDDYISVGKLSYKKKR